MKARSSRRSGHLAGMWIGPALILLSMALPAGGGGPAQAGDPSGHQAPSFTGVVQSLLNGVGASQPTATEPADDTQDSELTGEAIAETQPAEDSEEPAGDVRVSPQGRVEMHVRDLSLASVLQMLSMQSQRNIVASKDVGGRVTANLYNVTFEEALTAILDANGAGWREHGNFIYVYTKEELKEMQSASRTRVTRLFRLKYVRASDAREMIAPLLSAEGKVTTTPAAEMGVAANAEAAGGNTIANEDALLVVDYADRVEAIAAMLADLDTRPKQVLIEATILRAQLNEDNYLGIDFNLVGGVDFQNVASVSNPAGTNITIGNLPANQLQKTTIAANTDFASSVPNGGFTFGIIHNNVAMFIRALEQVTDTTVIANPKILTLNKQRGEVIVGRRDGYLTTTVTETSAVQNVQFLETGTQLRFRPFIGDDGYVRVEVHPEDSTGGLTAANLPFEQTTEVTTNIIVRDGNTILIGGLFREVTSAGREQIPIAGNLPIAGALFRNIHDNTQREEVIILLTVRIVKDPDTLAPASEEILNDVERYRVGMRRGLQWYGRERLAQAHYQWAQEHLQKGDIDKALWDLDLAINNSPKFVDAIKLKEQLTCKREWDDEAATIRGFISQQIAQETGMGPLFDRPGPPFSIPQRSEPGGTDRSAAPPATIEEVAPQ